MFSVSWLNKEDECVEEGLMKDATELHYMQVWDLLVLKLHLLQTQSQDISSSDAFDFCFSIEFLHKNATFIINFV